MAWANLVRVVLSRPPSEPESYQYGTTALSQRHEFPEQTARACRDNTASEVVCTAAAEI